MKRGDGSVPILYLKNYIVRDNRCGQFEKSEKSMYFENIQSFSFEYGGGGGGIIVKLIVKKKN